MGHRQDSSAIAIEYATADARYQAKTVVCVHVKSWCVGMATDGYRILRKSTPTTALFVAMEDVDGEVSGSSSFSPLVDSTDLCEAIAYGYFETLIHFGDGHKFLEEETRLRSLINTCVAAGFEEMMIEDFADVTFEVLRKVANAIHDGTAEGILHDSFNDDLTQNYIITHFRVRQLSCSDVATADAIRRPSPLLG